MRGWPSVLHWRLCVGAAASLLPHLMQRGGRGHIGAFLSFFGCFIPAAGWVAPLDIDALTPWSLLVVVVQL